MKNKRIRTVFAFAIFILLVFLAIALVFLNLGFGPKEVISSKRYYEISFVISGIGLVVFLFSYRIDAGKEAIEGSEMENIRFLTLSEMRKSGSFKVADFRKLGRYSDGTVISAEKKGNSVRVITTRDLHTLVIGSTGVGKTTGFIDQNIAGISSAQTKPSMVVSDPKGELFRKHAGMLASKGYGILKLDLRDPYSSNHWNPMSGMIRKIREIRLIEKELKCEDGCYSAGNLVFKTYRDSRIRLGELRDALTDDARDLVYTLCPVENREQPTWEEGARNLILGLLVAFCEDCISGKMEEEKLCMYNLYHNVVRYCTEDITELKHYLLEGRDEFSTVRGLVQSVLVTSDRTLTSYLSEVHHYVEILSDNAIISLTGTDDMNIRECDEKPTAVFVIIPDEKITRHRFATLFFSQVYKTLVEKAAENEKSEKNESARLSRNLYFILDEFGNLPKIDNFDSAVTVARSRGIIYVLAIQSYAQLTAKYGRDMTEIIKSNCNVKVFLGTDDPETRREFSEMCGQRKTRHLSINMSAEGSASSSASASTIPLISPVELKNINGDRKGDAIVSIRGHLPIKSRFTPSHMLSELYFGKEEYRIAESEPLDRSQVIYDIGKDDDDNGLMEALLEAEENESTYTVLGTQEDKIIDSINIRLSQLAGILPNRMYESLLSADIENLPLLLREFKGKLDPVISMKVENAAFFIEGELEKYKSI